MRRVKWCIMYIDLIFNSNNRTLEKQTCKPAHMILKHLCLNNVVVFSLLFFLLLPIFSEFYIRHFVIRKRPVRKIELRYRNMMLKHLCSMLLNNVVVFSGFFVAYLFRINCPSESGRCGILFNAKSGTSPSEWCRLHWHPIPRMQLHPCPCAVGQ
jgi:hypothetical protein